MLTLCKQIQHDNLLSYLVVNQYHDIELRAQAIYRIGEKLGQKYVHSS